jgi:hypothetical protein
LKLAATSGKLRRVFIWGSFVTAKPAPKDLDILLIMDEDFEVDLVAAQAQAVFDSTRARLLFESDVFWARASMGHALLDLWLDTYQTSRSFRKRGIVDWSYRDSNRRPHPACAAMHRQFAEDPSGGAQGPFAARLRSHGGADPALGVQQREQDILEYLSRDLEQPVASSPAADVTR